MYTLLLLVHWHCVTATTNVLHRFSSPPFISFYPPLFSLLFFYSPPLLPQWTIRSTIVSHSSDTRIYRFDYDAAVYDCSRPTNTATRSIETIPTIVQYPEKKNRDRSPGKYRFPSKSRTSFILLYFFSLFSICSNERSRFVFASKEPILRSRLAEITSLKNEYKKMKNRWLGDHSERWRTNAPTGDKENFLIH